MEHEKLKRVIQESVPGKQVTLAHVIAHPDADLYKKLGVLEPDAGALGILTITPTEGAIIAADVATKAADVTLAFVDRFSGAVVVFGDVQSVQTALEAVVRVLNETLSFAPAPITKSYGGTSIETHYADRPDQCRQNQLYPGHESRTTALQKNPGHRGDAQRH